MLVMKRREAEMCMECLVATLSNVNPVAMKSLAR